MKRGFTLIELLAVIVILAIIALIATPIVINIIEDSKKNSTLRSGELYLDAVEYSIVKAKLNNKKVSNGAYEIMENGSLCLNGVVSDDCIEVQVKGEIPKEGTIIIEGEKIKSTSIKFNNVVIVDGNLNPVCTITYDQDNDLNADTGDIIKCSTESFYVISNDGETISMLAMYNLNVGDNKYANSSTFGLQDEHVVGTKTGYDAYGGVSGVDTNYWYDCETDKLKSEYGENYPAWVYTDKQGNRNTKNSMYSYIDEYKNYLLNNGVTSVSATVISYEQLIELGCTPDSCINSQYEWVYSTSYLTGSTLNKENALTVKSDGQYGKTGNGGTIYTGSLGCGVITPTIPLNGPATSYGIRPVIKISVNEL